jgi:membrane protein required for colicin V production
MGLTLFDFIVLGLLAISAAVGFFRGAIREIAALVALVAAAVRAVLGLPTVAPLVRAVVHPDWLAAAATAVLIFGVVYIALRLVGAVLARRAHGAEMLGFLDRSLGLLIGLARGLIVLGALFLMFNAATPQDLRPHWIVGSRTWPLASNMGRVLTALAPQGLDLAGRLKPAFDQAVEDGGRDRSATDRYEAGDSERRP